MKRLRSKSLLAVPLIASALAMVIWLAHPVFHAHGTEGTHHNCTLCVAGATTADAPPPPAAEALHQPVTIYLPIAMLEETPVDPGFFLPCQARAPPAA